MTALEVPRADLDAALLARVREGAPLLLAGPPGAGKTTLLRRLALQLEREGWVAVQLDLMGAVSCPDRFVSAALDALPVAAFGRHLATATEIRRLAQAGRAHEAEAVAALLQLWGGLGEAGGRPVALLLDEATEIRSLAYFKGLREVGGMLAAALGGRRRGTLLATSFPTLARRLWRFETLAARACTAQDLAGLADRLPPGTDLPALAQASFGWPRYLRVLLERLGGGSGLFDAWAEEMAEGGRIEAACRHTYEALLLRSRGYGISKAVLAAVAENEGLNLTALVTRLGRTPGATRDYLQWLVGVDALRMQGKRYSYVDGMLREWVRLHARGVAATDDELRAAARRATASPAAEAQPAAAIAAASDATETPAAAPADPEPPAPRPRRESLMEID